MLCIHYGGHTAVLVLCCMRALIGMKYEEYQVMLTHLQLMSSKPHAAVSYTVYSM